MKKLFLSAALVASAAISFSQGVSDRSYLGVKLGMNASTNKFSPDIPSLETNTKTGFAGGIYYNIGVGRIFSIQPELLYSAMGSKVNNTAANSSGEGTLKLNYISLPILFKVNPTHRLGLFAGPQFDFLAAANSTTGSKLEADQKSNFKNSDFAWTAGAEFWLSRNIGIFGRYIGGMNNVDEHQSSNIMLPVFPVIPTPVITEIKNSAWQFGLTFGFKAKPTEPMVAVPVIPVVTDTDGDGIADGDDKCPNQAGTAKYGGCPIPDTDGDGINDDNDKCPNQAGTAKYSGCPVPDTDGDGINDENDQCPNQAGTAKYNGCPVPDTDGDGINDENDRCPKIAGIEGNLGCPEMILYYKRDEAKLNAEDKANLDKVVTFMNNNPDLNVMLEGHTSTLGDTKYNQTLSEKRAKMSVDYLVSKGIDKGRLQSAGFGEQFPIGDNSVEEGRAKSRRTVVKVAQ